MDLRRAQELIDAELDRTLQLLSGSAVARAEDLEAADGTSQSDRASPLTQELLDEAVAEGLRSRFAALQRADERLAAGTYGFSLHSGLLIPSERLEADPAAEYLVEEASNRTGARPLPGA